MLSGTRQVRGGPDSEDARGGVEMKLCMIGFRGHSGYVFESLKEVPFVELSAVSSG